MDVEPGGSRCSIGPIAARVVGAVLALPTILLGTRVATTAEPVALVVLLTAVLAVERWRGPDSRQLA